MNFFPQPYLAPSESASLGAKQGHAKSAKRDHFSASSFLKFRIPRVSASRNRGAHFAFPNKILPFRPLRPWREQSAFSLTEVVIAMGVAAVAFTSIIALFPLGLNMSKESYEATQAALIAQTILADVRDQQTGNSYLRTVDVFDFRQIQISKNSDPIKITNNYILVPINKPTEIQTVYIGYKPFTGTSDTDSNNNPPMIRPATYQLNGTAPDFYTSGSNGCFAVVKATFSPTLRYRKPTNSTLIRLDISVETPGNANISNRTCYLFTAAFRP